MTRGKKIHYQCNRAEKLFLFVYHQGRFVDVNLSDAIRLEGRRERENDDAFEGTSTFSFLFFSFGFERHLHRIE